MVCAGGAAARTRRSTSSRMRSSFASDSATRMAGDAPTSSELIATVHARAEDVAVTAIVSGVGGADRYGIRVWTDAGIHELVLPDDLDGLGYGGAADAVVQLARGVVAVDAARTAAVYRNTLAAARAARGEDAS